MLPIDDWGGFERLVATMHDTGSVTVQHAVVLQDSHGVPRQVDVLITHKVGMYEHRIIAECKYWNKRVPRSIVDALATSVRELNVSKGVIFSTVGFQKGAIQTAKALGVELFKVRALASDDWLIPGKVVCIYGQRFSRGIDEVTISKAEAVNGATLSRRLSFSFASPPSEFLRPELNSAPDRPALSLVKYIENFTMKKMIEDIASRGIIFECEQGESVFLRGQARMTSARPIIVPWPNGQLKIWSAEMDLAIKIKQVRAPDFDQAVRYDFILAIDDCVNQRTQIAWRHVGDAITQYEARNREALPQGHCLRNGIIFQDFDPAPFDFHFESARYGLEPVSHRQLFQALPASELPDVEWCWLSDGCLTTRFR